LSIKPIPDDKSQAAKFNLDLGWSFVLIASGAITTFAAI
jgi:hypothetical protein